MKQLLPLTGLRAIAAYSVLLAHSISTAFYYQGENLLQPFASHLAFFGMSLFFVLSGFVIYYNYADLINKRGFVAGGYEFIVARFARLYPLYILVIIFSLDGLPSASFGGHIRGMIAYGTMTQSWFDLQDITFQPAWSISTEWFFYLVFLFALPVFRKIRKPTFCLYIFLVLICLFLPKLLHHIKSHFSPQTFGWMVYASPYTRVFEFISGALAAKVYLSYQVNEQHKINNTQFALMLLCLIWCAALIVNNAFIPKKFVLLQTNFIFAPAISILLVLCCRFRSIFSAILSSRPLLAMGEISYSVYLLQFWMLTSLSGAYLLKMPPTIAWVNPIMKVIAIIGLTTIAAYGGYHLIEKPFRKLIRKLLLRRVRENESEVAGAIAILR